MARLNQIDPNDCSGITRNLLNTVIARFGMAPNVTRVMANSPAALDAYLAFSNALERGTLSARLRELIAVTVSECSGCYYCLSAHCATAHKLGIEDDTIDQARQGIAGDPKTLSVLRFARSLVDKRGWADDDDLSTVRKAGLKDAEIVEVLAVVMLTLFTNYLNHLAGTEVDFPGPPEKH